MNTVVSDFTYFCIVSYILHLMSKPTVFSIIVNCETVVYKLYYVKHNFCLTCSTIAIQNCIRFN